MKKKTEKTKINKTSITLDRDLRNNFRKLKIDYDETMNSVMWRVYNKCMGIES